jgi:hypothetical protein
MVCFLHLTCARRQTARARFHLCRRHQVWSSRPKRGTRFSHVAHSPSPPYVEPPLALRAASRENSVASGKKRPLPARRRKRRMPILAWRGNRPARRRREAIPNSGLVAQPKEAQKVTPWKNHLAETKPPNGFFARPPVTPWRGRSEPSFCFTRRARASGLAKETRRNPAFLLCTNRTFSLCTESAAQFACHQRAAEGTITGAGPAR